MICKYYEIEKFKNKTNYFLFYGENEGQKQDAIQASFSQFTKENTYKYSEKDVIENKEIFFENIYSKSFFENEKLILISDVSDKILNLIEEIITSKINDVIIILIAKRLEKFIEIKKLSQSAFANRIGIQRSTLAHFFSGRNKPSSDFLIAESTSITLLESQT